MRMRRIGLGFLAGVVGAFVSSCGKSDSKEPAKGTEKAATSVAAPAIPGPKETVRFHWIGKKRLAAETNATGLMTIWNMPESVALEAITLDKLALGLFATNRLPVGTFHSPNTNFQALVASNHVATLVRPLLDDVIQNGCYVEVRDATGQTGELAAAVRLEDARAGLWETNLEVLVESLGGTRPAPLAGSRPGWQGSISGAGQGTRVLSLIRSGGWVLLGLSRETNELLAEFSSRIEHSGNPVLAQRTNSWLEADPVSRGVRQVTDTGEVNYWLELSVDLKWVVAEWWGSAATGELPKLSVAVFGDGQNVRTRGRLNFTRPLELDLQGWNIPTNLIHDPMGSFTAVRGFQFWASSLKWWDELQLGPAPSQVFAWGHAGLPFSTYVAATVTNTSNFVQRLSQWLATVNPWLATNGLGQFGQATNGSGICWNDLLVTEPCIRPMQTPAGDFVVAELVPDALTNRPAPAMLLQQVNAETNLVLYDWEVTGPRIETWLYTAQFLRFALHKGQVSPNGCGVAWLRALEDKLYNAGTAVAMTSPSELTFTRKSTIGLTAPELHLLVDWLESPQFPVGLHTFLGTPNPLPRKKTHAAGDSSSTNAASAPR
jgi:hypothetical protein